jgi:hypothetical protein
VALALNFAACVEWERVGPVCQPCATYDGFEGCWAHPDGTELGEMQIVTRIEECSLAEEEGDIRECTRLNSQFAVALPEIGGEQGTEWTFSGWVVGPGQGADARGAAIVSGDWQTPGGGEELVTLELLRRVSSDGVESLAVRHQFSLESTELVRCR